MLDPGAAAWLVALVSWHRRTLALVLLAALAALGLGAAATAEPKSANQAIQQLRRTGLAPRVAGDLLKKAESAASRAEKARAAGDPAQAKRLEAVASEWAAAGFDRVRAAQMEMRAEKAQKQAAKLETRALRARALVEQTTARVGRAREKLERVAKERPDLALPAVVETKPAPAQSAGAQAPVPQGATP